VLENIPTWWLRPLIAVVRLLLGAHGMLDAQSEVGLRLQIMQSEGNRNAIGQTAAVPIAVRMTDATTSRLQGQLSFSRGQIRAPVAICNGGISFRMLTNEEGIATVKNYRPNRVEGRYPILVQAEYLGKLATGINSPSSPSSVPSTSFGTASVTGPK
jgi:hypothetical protein